MLALGQMHFIICLPESRVLTVLWLLHVSVSESKVFLERLYFSPTKYFIFIAKLNFPRPLTIQGTLAPGEDVEIGGFGGWGLDSTLKLPLSYTFTPGHLLRYCDLMRLERICVLPQAMPRPH